MEETAAYTEEKYVCSCMSSFSARNSIIMLYDSWSDNLLLESCMFTDSVKPT